MRQTFAIVLLAACAGCTQPDQEHSVRTQDAPSASESAESPITEQEKDSIRRQVSDHWLLDIGMPGLEKMVAKIVVELNPDGSVRSAKIDRSNDNGDPNWRKFAENCQRAVMRSSPLRMPANRPYEQWKQMTLLFNAGEMLQQ